MSYSILDLKHNLLFPAINSPIFIKYNAYKVLNFLNITKTKLQLAELLGIYF